jgi:hypothetical protein
LKTYAKTVGKGFISEDIKTESKVSRQKKEKLVKMMFFFMKQHLDRL